MCKRVSVYVERKARERATREGVSFRYALFKEWRRVNRQRRYHARSPGQSDRNKKLQGRRNGMDEEAVSPVIGVILLVAITVVMSALVFVLVSGLGDGVTGAPPQMNFRSDGDDYYLLSATPGLEWSRFSVTGCNELPSGNVTAGDILGDCTDPVRVVDTKTNSVIWSS